ncbi:hypothetical protein [Rubrivirga litoralis]|uniref:Uncharacterized protein n=1 Tax=Rubrivirga litoralis TaxID=3075598 RepID=A0ABU3BRP9_9BACT|nr:hypothetical protein [Rubrivirga sp. F394]MDT0631969.1 hypothetical protein [Rubrivirga sp. F394]
MSTTVLLAGRRPDPPDSDARRFPIENVLLVRERLRDLFAERQPDHLVCSAACGADLLALDIAGDLDIRRHVVLPFSIATFREMSVTDRPGHWGPLFDRLVSEVEARADLTILNESPGDDAAYAATNDQLQSVAEALGLDILAVAVWDGEPRGDGDLTRHLIHTSAASGADVVEVPTL